MAATPHSFKDRDIHDLVSVAEIDCRLPYHHSQACVEAAEV
jgi:hypothetical protein